MLISWPGKKNDNLIRCRLECPKLHQILNFKAHYGEIRQIYIRMQCLNIVYQQQHKSRDSNAFLPVRSSLFYEKENSIRKKNCEKSFLSPNITNNNKCIPICSIKREHKLNISNLSRPFCASFDTNFVKTKLFSLSILLSKITKISKINEIWDTLVSVLVLVATRR